MIFKSKLSGQFKEIKMKQTPDNRHKDPKNYKWKVFYFNKEDDRIFVPKSIEWMGITLNFANPKSYLALLAMIAFFVFIILMIETN